MDGNHTGGNRYLRDDHLPVPSVKSISKGTSLLIDIREELSLLENYFTIQSYRYGGTITMDIQVDNESLYNSEIIKFTLQPLVEMQFSTVSNRRAVPDTSGYMSAMRHRTTPKRSVLMSQMTV